MAYETAIVGGLVSLLFLWTYIAFSLGKDDKEGNFEPLKVLLLLMTFLGIGLGLFVMKLIADENLASVANLIKNTFNIYLAVFTFIFGYFFIMIMKFVFTKMIEKRK